MYQALSSPPPLHLGTRLYVFVYEHAAVNKMLCTPAEEHTNRDRKLIIYFTWPKVPRYRVEIPYPSHTSICITDYKMHWLLELKTALTDISFPFCGG